VHAALSVSRKGLAIDESADLPEGYMPVYALLTQWLVEFCRLPMAIS
jgi:hypothetical protein